MALTSTAPPPPRDNFEVIHNTQVRSIQTCGRPFGSETTTLNTRDPLLWIQAPSNLGSTISGGDSLQSNCAGHIRSWWGSDFAVESASRGLNEAPRLHRCPEVRGMPIDGYRGVSVSRSTSPVASLALWQSGLSHAIGEGSSKSPLLKRENSLTLGRWGLIWDPQCLCYEGSSIRGGRGPNPPPPLTPQNWPIGVRFKFLIGSPMGKSFLYGYSPLGLTRMAKFMLKKVWDRYPKGGLGSKRLFIAFARRWLAGWQVTDWETSPMPQSNGMGTAKLDAAVDGVGIQP